MKKRHIISTDDFEDYAPEQELAAANGNVLLAETSFTNDINSGRSMGRVTFVVKRRNGEGTPFVTPFLDLAIEHYNNMPF